MESHNDVQLNRAMLLNLLDDLQQRTLKAFGCQIRLFIHGDAVMLLHPLLSASSTRRTTRDIHYIRRTFGHEWRKKGVYDAEDRLESCINATALRFRIGTDWMNSDPDAELPFARDPKGFIYDPIYYDAKQPNNIDMNTIYSSPGLVLISVTMFWGAALKLVRYEKGDLEDVVAILRHGTKLNGVQWTPQLMEDWIKTECWPMGYDKYHPRRLDELRDRIDDAVRLLQDSSDDLIETIPARVSKSPEPETRDRSPSCFPPEQTKEVIRTSIKNAIRNSPLVLIDTLSGRLCDKSDQAAAFETTQAFRTLITSTTSHIDHALIERVVGEFYRYVTFSHTWQGREPLYETVIKTVVYNLEALPTHNKLKIFCQIAQDEGFNWAWSDTCCINKGDQFVLQEALISMFKWYEGSALTIIFLCDVDRLAEIGALMMSLWNSRGWTLQEYHASKVVRIYTRDWTPYLGLTIYNHKESPEIISEMERATGISAESLMALRPGQNDIREKLRLASTRQTTRVEDAAYSLLGIFSMTLPVTYGEGDKALGRLLSQLLTSSGDTSILAWTGIPSSFNSCLPTDIVVFSQPLTLHIPPPIPDAKMVTVADALCASSPDLDLVARLYEQLFALPPPLFVIQRMKLPCLAFKIRTVSPFRNGIFRAQAGALGVVQIKTRQNIAGTDSLLLIHPWIDFLLDRRPTGNIADITPSQDESSDLGQSPPLDSSSDLYADSLDAESIVSPSTVPRMEAQMEFLARLRQPFGAFLLAPTRRNVPEYKRIATENVITVQVRELTSATLNRLIQGVCVLDVL